MVFPLGMTLELRPIEVHIAEVSHAVPLCLVIKVRRCRMAAFSAGSDGLRTHLIAELYNSNETVAGGAVPFLCPWIRPCSEGGERPPDRRREAYRDTRGGVVERLHYVT